MEASMKKRVKHIKNKKDGKDIDKKKLLHPKHDKRSKVDRHPGLPPVPEEELEKYERGDKLDVTAIRSKVHRNLYTKREEKIEYSQYQAVRSEFLLTEESGYLYGSADKPSSEITQQDIANSVDITSATKHFNLDLPQFGPYCMNYSRNGRHLLLGGRRGHVAAMDWVTKQLMCEINVMESVHDVKWLQNETMFAVAQKQWLYIYDNQGVELHCVKRVRNVLHMEFLPYHYLLAAMREFRFLTWLDISVGRVTFEVRTEDRQNNAVCQNPQTALVMVGQGNGIVSMWSPNAGKPMVKMMCLPCPITAVSVDTKGLYMATAGANRMVKVWDLRNFKCLHSYRLQSPASHISISQTDQLALSMGSVVNVYRDLNGEDWREPYMYHKLRQPTSALQFCPYEDVLGVGHRAGFTSLIIPGAGEANFDALESNPFQTKSQRRETEIKTLLDKVPADLITVDPTQVKQVDVPSLEELMEEKKKEYPLAPIPKLEFEPRHTTRRKSTGVRVYQRKKKVQEAHKRETLKKIKSKLDRSKTEEQGEGEEGQSSTKRKKTSNVLDRFKPKSRR